MIPVAAWIFYIHPAQRSSTPKIKPLPQQTAQGEIHPHLQALWGAVRTPCSQSNLLLCGVSDSGHLADWRCPALSSPEAV